MLHRYQTQNYEMKEKGLNIQGNFINNLESLCQCCIVIKQKNSKWKKRVLKIQEYFMSSLKKLVSVSRTRNQRLLIVFRNYEFFFDDHDFKCSLKFNASFFYLQVPLATNWLLRISTPVSVASLPNTKSQNEKKKDLIFKKIL